MIAQVGPRHQNDDKSVRPPHNSYLGEEVRLDDDRVEIRRNGRDRCQHVEKHQTSKGRVKHGRQVLEGPVLGEDHVHGKVDAELVQREESRPRIWSRSDQDM